VANDIIAGLEQRFSGISGQVEMRDVATPYMGALYRQLAGGLRGLAIRRGREHQQNTAGLEILHGRAMGQSGRRDAAAVMSGNHNTINLQER